ncbi:MAG: YqgE/AlgH family protein [Cytophagales bacterium]|nr:MAG: YqgE/AlgH family protein [Cytophagales bacterium]
MERVPLAQGALLIATPFLGNDIFERSVVLLCDHQKEGTFGLIMNQMTELRLGDIWEESSYSDLPVFIGGPVEQNTLHFIHRLGDQIAQSIPIGDNLYWSGDYEQVKTLLQIGQVSPEEIRFFVGYSGWSEDQLSGEIDQDYWVVHQPKENDTLFSTPPKHLWRTLLKNMGGKHKAMANYPVDPRLN